MRNSAEQFFITGMRSVDKTLSSPFQKLKLSQKNRKFAFGAFSNNRERFRLTERNPGVLLNICENEQ